MVVIAKIIGCCAFHLPLKRCFILAKLRFVSSLWFASSMLFFLYIFVHKSKYICSHISCCIDNMFAFWYFLSKLMMATVHHHNSNLMLMYRLWRWRAKDMNLWMRLTRNLYSVANYLRLTYVFSIHFRMFRFFWWLWYFFVNKPQKMNDFSTIFGWIFN